MEVSEVKTYFERMVFYYYDFLKTKDLSKLKDELKSFEYEIEKALDNYNTVIIKETMDGINYCLETITRLKEKFNLKFIFLTRHSKAVSNSMNKMITEERKLNRFDSEDLDKLKYMDLYTPLYEYYNTFGGKIIITEELQEYPQKLFQEAFEYSGLIFKKDYLNFQPLSKKVIPEDMIFFQNWYLDCINSNCFENGVTNLKNIVIVDYQDIDLIQKNEIIYKKFVEERNSTKKRIIRTNQVLIAILILS